MTMGADGRSVLVVDDDEMNRLTLAGLLESEGYRAHTVEDGYRALEALEEEPFDAILLDILMPGIDGLEVLRQVKADSRMWRIPVVVISAVDETSSIVRCLELGAEDFVSKPFDPVVLRARINAALARRRFGTLEAEYQKMLQAQAAEIEALKARLAAYETDISEAE
jgi:DNA-binding response OmpR family regulator